MVANVRSGGFNWNAAVRRLAWGGATFLLLLPLVAMQFTQEVNWGPEDFIVMGAILLTCAGIVDFASRRAGNLAYLFAVVVAVGAAFLLTWVNLAVGIIGSEDNPMNLMFLGVILLTVAGAVTVRFAAGGMARVMFLGGAALMLVGAVTVYVAGGRFEPPGAVGVLTIILFFTALWLGSGALFSAAARGERPAA
jgi:hypothetical protein